MKHILILILFGLFITTAYSQKVPERSDMRAGNKLYEKHKYADAETAYRKGLEKNPKSLNAKYNLANSLYKQQNFEESEKIYKELIHSKRDSTKPASTYHNVANAVLKQAIKAKEEQGQNQPADQKKLKESIEAYKNALKLDPDDMETKSNLAYAQQLLSQDGGEGGSDNQDQDQNQDQNQDKDQNKDQDKKDDKDQDKDNQDKNDKDEDKGEKDKEDKGDDKKDEKENKGENAQNKMSKSDIDRMLEAVRVQDEKIKEKVDKEKARAKVKQKLEKNW